MTFKMHIPYGIPHPGRYLVELMFSFSYALLKLPLQIHQMPYANLILIIDSRFFNNMISLRKYAIQLPY